MKKSYTQKISLVFFVLFLVSMNHWIGWNHKTAIYIICSIILVCLKFLFSIPLIFNKTNITAISIVYVGHLLFNSNVLNNPLSIITQIATLLISVIFIISLPNNDKINIFKKITKWFAWLMIPALVIFFITLFIDIPTIWITDWSNEEQAARGYGINYNYIFLLRPRFNYIESGAPRFQGPFLEPGHLGMMCAFILYANKHDYSNKYNKIILLSLILSLSLAGWLLGIIGYLFSRYYEKKVTLSSLLKYMLLLIIFFSYANYYNDGNNVLNDKIVSRLQIDEEGNLTGDNRNSKYTNVLLANMSSDVKTFLWGYNRDYIESLQDSFETRIGGSGMRLDLVKHGFIPVSILLLFYFYAAFSTNDKLLAILTCIFLFLLAFQRFYPTWFAWIICYYAALTNTKKNTL